MMQQPDPPSSDLPTPPAPSAPARLDQLEDAVRRYIRASKSTNTRRAYRSDLADFTLWCAHHELQRLPATPETIASYITALSLAAAKPSTIQRRLAAISQFHQFADHEPSPTQSQLVRMTMAGIRRERGVAPAQKAPTLTPELRRIVETCPDDSRTGLRDRALLLLGFAGVFRRSELVAVDVADLEETADGLRIRIGRSNTDQEGAGNEKGVPFGQHPETCPIRALRAWREAAGIIEGPLFRPVNRHDRVQQGRLSDRGVALIVKRAAARAGLTRRNMRGTHYALDWQRLRRWAGRRSGRSCGRPDIGV